MNGKMRLISWNCQGAFRKKADVILKERPDILVVQECEHPDKLIFNKTTPKPNDLIWHGDNLHKGLGVFSYSDYKFQLLEKYNADLKIIAPISVYGGKMDFTLFAIWANNPGDINNRYVEQVWKAIKLYDNQLSKGKVILTGDFNSNKIWDRIRREGNHSAVVDRLTNLNIHSIYHKHLGKEQGKETHPTFYLHRNKGKAYHLDYCFASNDLYEKLLDIKIGNYKKWIIYSDHAPLIINFDL